MAQLTIYIDDDTLKKIEQSARQEKGSVSSWVKKRLTKSLSSHWPEGYFDVFGSLRDSGLERPKQGDLRKDCPREEL